MTHHQDIIEQYTAADEEQRIGLFLIHRGLREEFTKIDLTETVQAAAKTPATNRVDRRLHSCLGWLRWGRA